MFQLTPHEFNNLISHFARSRSGWGGRRKLPLVFTQEGVAMLSGILQGSRAIHVNIAIMRTFVKLREILALHRDLSQKLADFENKIENHDKNIHTLLEAIRKLRNPHEKFPKVKGFTSQ